MKWRYLLDFFRQQPRSCLLLLPTLLIAAVLAIPLFIYQRVTGRSIFPGTLAGLETGEIRGGDAVDQDMWNPPTGDATGGRTEGEWRSLLQDLSDIAISDPEIRELLTAEQISRRWLGEAPASDAAIAATERRLGIALPASYKAFLKVSNGWNHPVPFIRKLAPVEKIGWLRDVDPDLIRDWSAGVAMSGRDDPRPLPPSPDDDLAHTLVINLPHEEDDAAFFMLNPVRVTNGELEAWFFSNWNPGANAYRSFWDLMVAERESFRNLRD